MDGFNKKVVGSNLFYSQSKESDSSLRNAGLKEGGTQKQMRTSFFSNITQTGRRYEKINLNNNKFFTVFATICIVDLLSKRYKNTS